MTMRWALLCLAAVHEAIGSDHESLRRTKQLDVEPPGRDCKEELLKIEDIMPDLGQHYIGDYEPIHIENLHDKHKRARRSTARHPLAISFAAFNRCAAERVSRAPGALRGSPGRRVAWFSRGGWLGRPGAPRARTYNLRLENNADRTFGPGFHIEVNSAQGTKILQKEFDRSIFYGGYLEGEEHTTEVMAHVDRGVLVAHMFTPEGHVFVDRADKYFTNPAFSNVVYRGATANVSDALHATFHGEGGGAWGRLLERQKQFVKENDDYHAEQILAGRSTEHLRQPRQDVKFDINLHNACPVLLIADHTFTSHDAANDPQRAATLMTQFLAGATLIYRFTQFDVGHGLDDKVFGRGVSFLVSKIVVYTEVTDPDNKFDDAFPNNPFKPDSQFHCSINQQSVVNENADCFATSPCAQEYLDGLSRSGGTMAFKDYCLVHAFTAKDFCQGILGLAWVGSASSNGPGLCHGYGRDEAKYLNTGISTSINFGTPVSTAVTIITLAHEFGHNFGSQHDTPSVEFTDPLSGTTESCTPGSPIGGRAPDAAGNYIMFYKATDGEAANNNQFSPCSRSVMGNILNFRGSTCLTSVNFERCGLTMKPVGDGTFCGNGEVGEDEECDCGTKDPVRCAEIDPCCTVNCKLAEDAECSPLKGPCCTPECKMKGLSFDDTIGLYLDMKNFQNTSDIGLLQPVALDKYVPKPITELYAELYAAKKGPDDPFTGPDMRCGLADTECSPTRYCIADKLFLGTCPSRDFVFRMKPTADGHLNQSTCFDYGCKADDALADGEEPCAVTADDVQPCMDVFVDPTDRVGGARSSYPQAGCYPFQSSLLAECNNGNNFCRAGGCVGSLCSAWPATDSFVGKKPSALFQMSKTGGAKKAVKCRVNPRYGESASEASVYYRNAINESNAAHACSVACRFFHIDEDFVPDTFRAEGGELPDKFTTRTQVLDATCIPTSQYFHTEHGQEIASAVPPITATALKREPGSTCYFGTDAFGGQCKEDAASAEIVCGDKQVALSAEFNPEAAARWIQDNLQTVLIAIGVTILLAIAMRVTYKQKKVEINSKIKQFKAQTVKSRGPREFDGKAPITSAQAHKLRKQLKRAEAVKRLEKFFPGAKRDRVDMKMVVQQAENERAAVKRLLRKGYGFAVPKGVPLIPAHKSYSAMKQQARQSSVRSAR